MKRDQVRAYIFSYELLRASERAMMRSFAQTQLIELDLKRTSVRRYLYTQIWVEIYLKAQGKGVGRRSKTGLTRASSIDPWDWIRLNCLPLLSSWAFWYCQLWRGPSLISTWLDCSFPTLWRQLQMQIDCAPILQDRLPRNFNWATDVKPSPMSFSRREVDTGRGSPQRKEIDIL